MKENYTKNSRIGVDFGAPSVPLPAFWNATGYANADFTYVPVFRRLYEYLTSYSNHMVYMRMHNILSLHGKGDHFFLKWEMDYGNRCLEVNNLHNGDDIVVSMNGDGSLRYDWTYVDKVYDILVEYGMKPISELCYLPSSIRKSAEEYYIPSDYKLYGQVIEAFVQHCVDRYGIDEVLSWYFEIWNEPDNKPKWCADPSTFLAMYDYMEQAVHSVDERLRVGGPATMQNDTSFPLFERFLAHCDHELNFCTGAYGARLDFISVHCKGGRRNSYSASTDIMFDSLKRYTEIIKKFPKFKNTEFFNDESDIVWAGNAGIWESSWLNFRNTHYASGFVCKMVDRYCEEIADDGINLAIADSDNAHLQWERFLFSGNRSQLTPMGSYPTFDILKKPFFNTYVLLSRLGDQRWKPVCENPDYGKKFGVLPTAIDDITAVLVWNFEDGIADDLGERTLQLELSGLKPQKTCRVVEYRIDKTHSNSNTAWHEMGAPQVPSREQAKRLRSAADLETTGPVQEHDLTDGKLSFTLEMPPHSVSLLLIAPAEIAAPAHVENISAEVEAGCDGKPQVFLKWKPSREKTFLHYVISRSKNGGTFEVICDRISQNTATFVDMDIEVGEECVYRIEAVNMSMQHSKSTESESVQIRM